MSKRTTSNNRNTSVSDDDILVPPSKKKPRKSRDDLTENEVFEERTRTVRQRSEKQQRIDAEGQQRKTMELQNLRRQNKELRKLLATSEATVQPRTTEGRVSPSAYEHLPVESEDEDEEETATANLHSAFRKGSPIMQTPRPTRINLLRREGDPIPSTPRNYVVPPTPATEGRQHYGPSSPAPHSPIPHSPIPQSPTLTANTPHPRELSSPMPQNSQQRLRPERSSSSIASTVATSTLKPALFRAGEQPKGRPKVHDYEDYVKSLLIEAIRIFECFLYTINPFPNPQETGEWVREIWRMVCAAREDPQQYELTDRMIQLIITRKSNARGDVVDLARTLTPKAYHFQAGDKKNTERKNLQCYRELTDDSAFHYKTFDAVSDTRSGFSQHPYIFELIQKAFFKNTRSLGVEFRKYFDPIPMVTIAFVLTAISANINEWSTGKHIQTHFRESDQKDIYLNYLGDLQRWEKSAPQVVTNIRKKWHDRARRIAGAMIDDAVNRSVSENAMKAAQLELQGRSGLTDSEDDGDGNVDE
ncbi:hypothetical protein A0H81_10480 [Grifola frondosa]|uniref:DUF6532 domain-containing protein n=1 Tax=Grifola frondosa TaxID=5627 RepID=A0A1C7LZV5_GRIFR|nr:hypothetical protein A0H81_10480 [Grifola frondosa]